MVPGTEYGTVHSVLDEYTYSCSQDFDCRLKTANEKFIGDFVMLNIFYIHFCRLVHSNPLGTTDRRAMTHEA
jgi:hypothetical protein